MNRTDTEQMTMFNDAIPANHTHKEHKVGLWPNSHDVSNFSSDRPMRTVRSFTEAQNQARNRLGFKPNRAGRPKRKNI